VALATLGAQAMVIRRIGPLSCAKIVATLYAILGLVFGAIFSVAALVFGFNPDQPDTPPFMQMIGVGAVFVFPVFYGCLGFIVSFIAAWLYNVLAGLVGGIEIEIQ
jgi:hypothetical protein